MVTANYNSTVVLPIIASIASDDLTLGMFNESTRAISLTVAVTAISFLQVSDSVWHRLQTCYLQCRGGKCKNSPSWHLKTGNKSKSSEGRSYRESVCVCVCECVCTRNVRSVWVWESMWVWESVHVWECANKWVSSGFDATYKFFCSSSSSSFQHFLNFRTLKRLEWLLRLRPSWVRW